MTTLVAPKPQSAFFFCHHLEVIALHAIWASDGLKIRHSLTISTIAPIPNDDKSLVASVGPKSALLTDLVVLTVGISAGLAPTRTSMRT